LKFEIESSIAGEAPAEAEESRIVLSSQFQISNLKFEIESSMLEKHQRKSKKAE
jgi:hypothetical protein